MPYLYHLTNEKSLKNILKNGLQPKIGKNSKACGEKNKLIYLSDYEDVPYWKILLGQNILLRVNTDKLSDFKYCRYDFYNEYLYDRNIPAEYITVEDNLPQLNLEQRKEFTLSAITTIGKICRKFCDYKIYEDKSDLDFVNYRIENMKTMLSNLDFSELSKVDVINHIENLNEEGIVTLTDFCYDLPEETRLWELLNSEDYSNTLWLYRFIEKHIKQLLPEE